MNLTMDRLISAFNKALGHKNKLCAQQNKLVKDIAFYNRVIVATSRLLEKRNSDKNRSDNALLSDNEMKEIELVLRGK